MDIKGVIEAITNLLKVIASFFKKSPVAPEITSESIPEDPMEDLAELKKDNPNDPTVFVRLKKK